SPKWSVATPKKTIAPEAMPSAVSAANRLERFDGVLGARPRLSELFQQSNEPSRESDSVAATGGAAPNDNLQDVAPGDGTYLNTREWKYAAFFNRVKQAVSARWDPQSLLKKRGMGVND